MTLGPISLEESTKLAALVHAAQRIIDIGVTPVRVWKISANCSQHGRLEREETLLLTEPEPRTVKCYLCAVLPWQSSEKAADSVTCIRG